MKILVLVKEVPDTAAARTLDAETGLLERGKSESVPDEINERTLEHALRYRDGGAPVEIVVLAVAPASAEQTMRKVLAMGADAAIIVADEAIAGADAVRTAQILAGAIAKVAPDLVLAGNQSTDGGSGVVPAIIAEYLSWPVLPSLGELEISATGIAGSTLVDAELLRLRAGLPAIASVNERSAEPRFPNFKGIMQAKKKPLDVWTLADVEPAAEWTSASVMVSAQRRPARGTGVKIVDDGAAATQLVDFLASHRLL